MTWIDDNKGAGPWTFSAQKNKWGYLNNPNWSDNADAVEFSQSVGNSIDPDDHHPCGHWHKGSAPASTTYASIVFWQQSIDVLKDEGITAYAGMSYALDGYYIIQLRDSDDNLLAVHTWDTIENSGNSMQVKIRNYGGEIKAFYMNYDNNLLYMYTLTTTGEYSKTLLFESVADPFQSLKWSFGNQTIAISSTGVVVCVTDVSGNDGSAYNGFLSRRSTNGSTWEAKVLTKVPYAYSDVVLVVDSGDTFYTFVNTSGDTPEHPFDMWESTDNGVSWDEILTTPATPVSRGQELVAAVDGTKIYALTNVIDGGTKSYLYASDDGGATWTATAVAIAGETYFRYCSLFVYDSVIAFTGRGNTTFKHLIYRSTDAGANWTLIGQIQPVLTWPTFIYQYAVTIAFNQNEDVFIYTHCGAYIDGSDTLGYLKSVDSGETWTAEETPMSYSEDNQTVIGYSEAVDEPQIWPLPGE